MANSIFSIRSLSQAQKSMELTSMNMNVKLESSTLGSEMDNMNGNSLDQSFLGSLDRICSVCVRFERAETRSLHLVRSMARSNLAKFQIDAIENMVYRPKKIFVQKIVSRRRYNLQPEPLYISTRKMESVEEVVDFQSQSDIGITVVNDLLPGSGKKLISMISSIYFAIHRRQEVVERQEILLREQRIFNWFSRMKINSDNRQYTDAVVVMTPIQCVSRWEKAASDAVRILGMNLGLHIYINPDRNADRFEDTNQVKVLLFTSIFHLKRFFPDDDGFVPVFIVDDFVSKEDHNTIYKNSEETPIFGRLVLVSSSAGDFSSSISGSRRNSIARMITSDGLYSDTTLLGNVQSSVNILSCSILPTIGMSSMKNFMVEGLSKTRLDTYTIKYKVPTWNTISGNSESVFGMIPNVEDIRTGGDLYSALENMDINPSDTWNNKVRFMLSFLETFFQESDKCPICLEGFQADIDVSIISPCFHFVCNKCMKRCLVSSNYCPMCRVKISGMLDVLPVKEKSLSRGDVNTLCCETFDDLLSVHVGPNPSQSMEKVCGDIIASLSMESVHKKLVVLAPYYNFDLLLKKSVSRFGGFKVDIRGFSKRNFQERVEWFGEKSEDTLKVLCICNIRELSWVSEISDIDAICDVRTSSEKSVRKLDKDPISFFSRISRIDENGGNRVRIFNVTPCE